MANTVNQFFKENRKDRKPIKFAASEGFTDDKGEALEWELRPIPSKRMEMLRKIAKDKDGNTDNNKLGMLMIADCVKFPPLNDSALQDSYGVKSAEDLVYEMLYADELDRLLVKVLELNGFKDNIDDLVEQAKN